jgi:hypothetical protein
MKPWIFKIFFVGSVAFLCGAVAFGFLVLGFMRNAERQGVRDVTLLGASKGVMKQVARKVKQRMYYEATIHNPDGDTLPDWIDDAVLGTVKKIF